MGAETIYLSVPLQRSGEMWKLYIKEQVLDTCLLSNYFYYYLVHLPIWYFFEDINE